jgi:WD40 repeat protein
MFDAFLSYARGDDEPFVKRLCQDLTARGFQIWWDRKDMPNRGLTFLQEIRDSIDQSERLIAVAGPRALTSEYVRAEWEHARLFSKGVIAIPRLSAYEQIPAELSKFHGPDFRDDSRYETALDELSRLLRVAVKPLGPLRGVPALPAYFLPRQEALTALHDRVLADIERPVVVAPKDRVTALLGLPGAGKSVVAAAFARTADVRRAFSDDGIIWITVGQNPAAGHIAQVLGAVFGVDAGPDPTLAYIRVGDVLRGRHCLIVLDDVWAVSDAQDVVNVVDDRSRLLITTREGSVASAFGGGVSRIGTLNDEASLQLLAAYSGAPRDSLPALAGAVAMECGGLPFALALCGRMIADGSTWEDLVHALRNADLGYIESELPNYPYKDLLRPQEVSVAALAPALAERYRDLAVFPPDRAVPESAAVILWSASGASDSESRKMLALLQRKSLIQLDGSAPARSISMHDLQHDYLRATVKDVRARHGALVEAYRKVCNGVWSRGPNDGYFFESLPTHLVATDLNAEYESLLLDFDWLQTKLDALGVTALLSDFRVAAHQNAAIHAVEETIRRSAMILVEQRGQLAGQLLGRLQALPPSGLEPFLEQARRWRGRPWLRPLTGSLLAPGAAICATLEGHEGSPRSVAISPDGKRAASAGNSNGDGTVRVWDSENGTPMYALAGEAETGGYTPIAFSRGGEWLLTGAGSAIRVWTVASGKKAFELAGHAGRVVALAAAVRSPRAVSISEDGAMFVWDLEQRSGRQITASPGPTSVAISVDGRWVAAISPSELVHIEVDTGQSRRIDIEPGRSIGFQRYCLTVSAAGDRVYFGSPLRFWEPATGAVGEVFPGTERRLATVALSAEAEIALLMPDERSIEIWRRGQGHRSTLPDQNAWVYCNAITPDGSRVVVGLNDHRVRLWDAGLAPTRGTAPRPADARRTPSFFLTGKGRYAVVAFGTAEKVVLDLEDGRPVPPGPVVEEAVREASAEFERRQSTVAATVGVEGDEAHTAVLAVRGSKVIATARQRAKTGEYEEPDDPDGRSRPFWLLEAGSADRIVFSGHSLPVTAADFSGDGSRIISGSIGRKLRVWDAESGRQLKILRGHKGSVYAISAAANAGRAASAAEDRTVRVWDLDSASSDPLATFTGEIRIVKCAVTPDGNTVIAGEEDGRIHVLRLEGHPSG